MIRFYFILMAMAVPLLTMSQMTGGGTKDRPTESNTPKGDKPVLKSSFYINWMRSSAIGALGNELNEISDFGLNGAGGMDKGWGSSLGVIFYFNDINLGQDNIKLGMDIGGSFVSVQSSMQGPTDSDGFDLYSDDIVFIALEPGILFSYNPVGKLILDARFSVMPTIIEYDQTFYNSPRINSFGSESYPSFYSSSALFVVRYGLGFAARYRPFIFGLDWSWGQLNGDFTYSDPDFAGFAGEGEAELGTGRFDLVFGFAF